eukprot:4938072-Ditylum_brightwellii.AAC.1
MAWPLWGVTEPKTPGEIISCCIAGPFGWETGMLVELVYVHLLWHWKSILWGIGIVKERGFLHWKRGNAQCNLLANIGLQVEFGEAQVGLEVAGML